MIDLSPLPHNRRNFVHKRIGRAVGGFVSSGFNPISAAGAFFAPEPARNVQPRTETARPSARSARGVNLGRRVKFASPRFAGTTGTAINLAGQRGTNGCPIPFQRPDPVTGECTFFLGDRPGPDSRALPIGPGLPGGEAVMGQFGAALVPGSRIIDRAECIRGMVVGSDGLCYNKSQIKNSDRMWPKGRRPLLTGGDMAAISKAARAAGRLERTTKRLQKIGLMKKPSRPARRVTSGPTEHHHHS